MKGLSALRIALATIQKNVEPVNALAYIVAHRAPRSLEDVEQALLNLSAAVEDALAHVRQMRHVAWLEQHPTCTCTPGTRYHGCPTHGESPHADAA